MIKKAVILCLFLFMVLHFTIKTAASVATLYVGGVVGGKETADNYTSGSEVFSVIDLSNTELGFTYISKFRFCLDYITGSCSDGSTSAGMQNLKFKLGYPVINGEKFIIYLTAGFDLNVLEEVYKGTAGMLGGDMFYVFSDHFLMEGDFQFSFLGATYHEYASFTDYPLEQINLNLKAQFIFSNRISLVVAYRLTDLNVKSALIIDDISRPSVGLVYKF